MVVCCFMGYIFFDGTRGYYWILMDWGGGCRDISCSGERLSEVIACT